MGKKASPCTEDAFPSSVALGLKPFQATYGHSDASGKLWLYVLDNSWIPTFMRLNLSTTEFKALWDTESKRDIKRLYWADWKRMYASVVVVAAAATSTTKQSARNANIFAAFGFFFSSVILLLI
jgi:hypothetical protein